ncbi:hypothetical protein JOD82_002140 [Paenibacillus sp. 1182]|uniref:beta barrel domain-containing protein n=1 Tax=Paenibacillus sp. 1182 TaxID=2806565 RepID=UPI001AE4F049|nr:hypothetical protein [Paenibacillus sp. 1182]MBP1309120.1 hypothetical protein [Paenibacillus sp. 1182]
MKQYQFKKEQKVYLTLGVNRSRDNKKEYIEGVVTKLGRKYVTVKIGYSEYQFDLTNRLKQKTEYAQDYYLYETLEDLIDEKERDKLEAELASYFSSTYHFEGKLTLDQMQRIKEIISE